MNETSRNITPRSPRRRAHRGRYYWEDYGCYAPDWIPRPDDVSSAAWDRYHASKPGSRKHRAAYAAMHQEVSGRGFPGPGPDRSYLADHGNEPGADRFRAPERAEPGLEPAGAWDADPEAG